MTVPTTDWPKPYLLQLHKAAVENGLVFVEGISRADAESLKSRFYRIRRRSDKSMAAFISPEYHMVMVGEWQPGIDDLGRLPIIYSALPSGKPLPKFRAASGEEIAAHQTPPPLAEPAPKLDPGELLDLAADIKMDEAEIDDFVSSMMKKAKKEA